MVYVLKGKVAVGMLRVMFWYLSYLSPRLELKVISWWGNAGNSAAGLLAVMLCSWCVESRWPGEIDYTCFVP